MKQGRLFLFLLVSVLMLASCTKEPIPNNNGNNSGGNGGSNVNIPSQASVKVGHTYNLGSTQSWTSSKTFVATVSSDGTITGQHVGNCTISCPLGSCRVNVTATINLFSDPITQWGLSKSQVISQAGYNYQETANGDLAYETSSSVAPYLGYNFTNGALSSTMMFVYTSYTNQVVDHLSERYKFMYKEGSSFVFLNGNSLSESNTMVILKYYNSSYWAIIYSKI